MLRIALVVYSISCETRNVAEVYDKADGVGLNSVEDNSCFIVKLKKIVTISCV